MTGSPVRRRARPQPLVTHYKIPSPFLRGRQCDAPTSPAQALGRSRLKVSAQPDTPASNLSTPPKSPAGDEYTGFGQAVTAVDDRGVVWFQANFSMDDDSCQVPGDGTDTANCDVRGASDQQRWQRGPTQGAAMPAPPPHATPKLTPASNIIRPGLPPASALLASTRENPLFDDEALMHNNSPRVFPSAMCPFDFHDAAAPGGSQRWQPGASGMTAPIMVRPWQQELAAISCTAAAPAIAAGAGYPARSPRAMSLMASRLGGGGSFGVVADEEARRLLLDGVLGELEQLDREIGESLGQLLYMSVYPLAFILSKTKDRGFDFCCSCSQIRTPSPSPSPPHHRRAWRSRTPLPPPRGRPQARGRHQAGAGGSDPPADAAAAAAGSEGRSLWGPCCGRIRSPASCSWQHQGRGGNSSGGSVEPGRWLRYAYAVTGKAIRGKQGVSDWGTCSDD